MAEHQIRFDDGAAYERMMGAWSRLAGGIFLDWVALRPGAARREVGQRTLTSVATFVKFDLQEQIPSPRCSFNKLPIA